MPLTLTRDDDISDSEWLNELHVEFERQRAYGELLIKYERGSIVIITKAVKLKKPKNEEN